MQEIKHSLEGTLKGAAFGALSAGIAYGIGEAFGHAGGIFGKGVSTARAVGKSLAHALSRGAIAHWQGGTFRSGFASGFAASFFSPGTTMGGDGAGGFTLRTTIAGITGGTASEIGGGKFSNGAVTGAFVHMFNDEMTQDEISLHNKKVLAREKAFSNAYGTNGEAYMKGDTTVARRILSIGVKSLALGVSLGGTIFELGYGLVASVAGGVSTVVVSSGIFTELELGFGSTNYKTIIKNNLKDN